MRSCPLRFLCRMPASACMVFLLLAFRSAAAQTDSSGTINLSGFTDSAHHWYDIRDDEQVISPLPAQARYPESAVRQIADNVLLYQKVNGGWPKNYDMRAVLTDAQKTALAKSAADTAATTFDNGATHSHTAYLAAAYARTGDERYRNGCLRGIDFMLRAQYANGGWPQFYPAAKGYARYITFNDGAMIGVMEVLHAIVRGDAGYGFVDAKRRGRVQRAFDKGIDCILGCQIREDGRPTVWCQQHDERTLLPQSARTFEPACMSNQESADIVEFLMSIDRPDARVVRSVMAAEAWFRARMIAGLRVETVRAPIASYQYHTTDVDRQVAADPGAPPIWSRFTEPGTHRALFSNRNWKKVYSLAEVDRERRTGYAWYTYAPQRVLDAFPAWKRRCVLR